METISHMIYCKIVIIYDLLHCCSMLTLCLTAYGFIFICPLTVRFVSILCGQKTAYSSKHKIFTVALSYHRQI